jgi:hypothetical protein
VNDQDAINQSEWEKADRQTINFSHPNAGWMMLGLSSVPLGFLLPFVLYRFAK